MDFKNRKWWQWLAIVFGALGVLSQAMVLWSPSKESFSWFTAIFSVVLIWVGTAPRKVNL
ncbi:MAG: hypothetical protein R2811_15005 [Flavobacteriales bacterium]